MVVITIIMYLCEPQHGQRNTEGEMDSFGELMCIIVSQKIGGSGCTKVILYIEFGGCWQ